jgi:hypothetical protein
VDNGPDLYCLMNRIAVIKPEVELLERRADLTEDQHRLAETVLRAADALTADLVARPPAVGPVHGVQA